MSDIFKLLKDDMKKYDWVVDKELSTYLGIHLAYYVLCITYDLRKIKAHDLHIVTDDKGTAFYTVKYEAVIHTDDEYLGEIYGHKQEATEKRKNTVEPFTFDLPMYVTADIDLYLHRAPESKMNIQLVKNANKQATNNAKYSQGTSKKGISDWGKILAQRLNISN